MFSGEPQQHIYVLRTALFLISVMLHCNEGMMYLHVVFSIARNPQILAVVVWCQQRQGVRYLCVCVCCAVGQPSLQAAMRDYYAILRVARTATNAEIKAAYRQIALVVHPDVNKGGKVQHEHEHSTSGII